MESKPLLLKMCRIQQIELCLTRAGVSRDWIHREVIYPNFFIGRKTYYKYLNTNAKKALRDGYGVNWEEELNRLKPINYMQLMREVESQGIFNFEEEPLTAEQKMDVIKNGMRQ